MSENIRKKCEVNGNIIEPCEFLDRACEFGNPTGKKKGLFCWDLFELTDKGLENTRRFFGVKTTHYINGIKFEYCPFCGVAHTLQSQKDAVQS